ELEGVDVRQVGEERLQRGGRELARVGLDGAGELDALGGGLAAAELVPALAVGRPERLQVGLGEEVAEAHALEGVLAGAGHEHGLGQRGAHAVGFVPARTAWRMRVSSSARAAVSLGVSACSRWRRVVKPSSRVTRYSICWAAPVTCSPLASASCQRQAGARWRLGTVTAAAGALPG